VLLRREAGVARAPGAGVLKAKIDVVGAPELEGAAGATQDSARLTATGSGAESTGAPIGSAAAAGAPAMPPQDRATVTVALRSHYLFSWLAPSEVEGVVAAMTRHACKSHEVLVDAAARVDTNDFFIVVAGSFTAAPLPASPSGGSIATRALAAGDAFGDNALLYPSPPEESLAAGPGGGAVYVLNGAVYRRVLATTARRNLTHVHAALRSIPLLKALNRQQLAALAVAVKEETYPTGAKIIRKGDAGDACYFLLKGEVLCCDIGSGAEPVADVPLTAGACFGERALLLNEPRGEYVCCYV
jgi:CRP-like cAMP-binding protein